MTGPPHFFSWLIWRTNQPEKKAAVQPPKNQENQEIKENTMKYQGKKFSYQEINEKQ